jgi:hypothetical protein
MPALSGRRRDVADIVELISSLHWRSAASSNRGWRRATAKTVSPASRNPAGNSGTFPRLLQEHQRAERSIIRLLVA